MVRSVVGKVVWMASAAETKHKKRGPSSRRLSLVMAFFLAVATLMATATAALAVAFSNTTFMTTPQMVVTPRLTHRRSPSAVLRALSSM